MNGEMRNVLAILFSLFINLVQAQSLTLDICDSIPSNLYEQELSSLTVTNGQGYCHSYNKILDKRIRKFKNLKQLSYNDQDFYSRGQLHLPKEICKLKRLETLYTNSIIPEIFELRNLKVLGLNLSNDTAGVAYKKGFEDFTELEDLQLSFSQVSVTYKLDGIASLSKLRKVTLHNPNQNVINEVLANPNITHLIIQHAKGKSYDFSKLKGLTTLSLTFCDITSIPKSVFGLSKLDTLNLTYNKISIVPQYIGTLKNLKSLSLSHNTLYSISSRIGECKGLEVLHLDYNRSLSLLPREIGKLGSLREFRANNCKLLDLLPQLEKCSALELVEVAHNQIKFIYLDFRKLPNLKSIFLNDNKLVGLPSSFYFLSLVTKLDLSDNRIISLPSGIEQMTQLTSLSLNNNELTEVPSGVSELVNLNYLSTYGNKLNRFPSVSQLTKLESLFLGDNSLNQFPDGMKKLKHLRLLEIQENLFEEFPSFIYSLPDLERIWLDENLRTKSGFIPVQKPQLHFR